MRFRIEGTFSRGGSGSTGPWKLFASSAEEARQRAERVGVVVSVVSPLPEEPAKSTSPAVGVGRSSDHRSEQWKRLEVGLGLNDPQPSPLEEAPVLARMFACGCIGASIGFSVGLFVSVSHLLSTAGGAAYGDADDAVIVAIIVAVIVLALMAGIVGAIPGFGLGAWIGSCIYPSKLPASREIG
jgi:hypothetical protein